MLLSNSLFVFATKTLHTIRVTKPAKNSVYLRN